MMVLTSTTDKKQNLEAKYLELCISQIAQGEQAALADLYEQTKDSVYGFALSILKNTSDAQDVLQSTYLSVYEAAAAYLAQGKPMAWILRIARNFAFMKIRERSKTADFEESAWQFTAKDNGMVTVEDQIVLEAVMQNLAVEERQIIILHAVAGFKFKDIAALLALPLATVLSKYHRALKKLKILLKEEC